MGEERRQAAQVGREEEVESAGGHSGNGLDEGVERG